MKKILIFAVSVAMLVGCGKERYAEINTDPSAVTKPDLSFLFLQAQNEFKGSEYWAWFYGFNRSLFPWSQMMVGPTSSDGASFNTNTMFDMDARGGNPFSGTLYSYSCGGIIKDLQFIISNMEGREKDSYQYLHHMSQIMFSQLGLLSSDFSGEIIYAEALKGLYTNPPLLRPKYDTQEAVYAAIDEELKKAITVLSNPVLDASGNEVPQYVIKKAQEPVYGGSPEKWVKFANSVRLKLALRLLHANPAKAKEIAAEVAKSSYMTTNDDDYRIVSAKRSYGPGTGTWPGKPSTSFIKLLKKNRDPRIRVFFAKNPYNPGVVQGMLDQGLTFPEYIAKEMVVEGGKFIRWKSREMGDGEEFMGEPWVRYQGIPLTQMHDLSQAEIDSYAKEDNYKVDIDGVKRVFNPFSLMNKNLLAPDANQVYPSMNKVQDEYRTEGAYNYTLVVNSAAETQLILAIFGLQGVDLNGATPAELYKNAITCSVKGYDQTAKHHNLLYYKDVYDKTKFVNNEGKEEVIEKVIALGENELDEMLQLDGNKLTGNISEDIEKCFIQLTINAFQYPGDIYTYIKLGGIPKRGSNVWPREQFVKDAAIDAQFNIPRRFIITTPSESNINYANYMESLNRQGFKDFNLVSPPMNQRYWNDKNSPDWGAGPIVR